MDHPAQFPPADDRGGGRARLVRVAPAGYVDAQAKIDGGSPGETLALLALVGPWREQREADRGGASLQIPEQEVVQESGRCSRSAGARGGPPPLQNKVAIRAGGWSSARRFRWRAGTRRSPLHRYRRGAHHAVTARSAFSGRCRAADPGALRRLRRMAKALRIEWPEKMEYPDFLRSLDPRQPRGAAMMNACTALFRGAAYCAFSGGVPNDVEHAALAIEYAHVTAPLRRLVDRYSGEICVALCADRPVPDWVSGSLDGLVEEMATAERRAKKYERAIVDLVEVFLLRDRVGEEFDGTVIEVEGDRNQGTVMIAEPRWRPR